MTVLLSAQNLTKSYGPRPLFAGLSLDLCASERVGLIGPNGSGKSTLLRLLAGLEEPDAGSRSLRPTAPLGYLVATHDRAFLRAVADEIVEINRVYPGGSFRAAGSYDEFAERREEFLEAQARRQESVANQVRRETEWLGRKAAARTRKSGARIDAAGRRREELAELKYRNAAAGTAGIDFVSTGRATRKLLTVTGLAKSLGGRPLFAGL